MTQNVHVLTNLVSRNQALISQGLTDREQTDVHQTVTEIPAASSQEVNLHQEKDQKEEALINHVLKDQIDPARTNQVSTGHVLPTLTEIPVVSSQEVNLHQEKDQKIEASINLVLKDPVQTGPARTDRFMIARVLQTATEIHANINPEKDQKEEVLTNLVLGDQKDLKDQLLTNRVHQTATENLVGLSPVRIDQEVNLHQEKDQKDGISTNLVQTEVVMHHVLLNQPLQTEGTKSLLLKKKAILRR